MLVKEERYIFPPRAQTALPRGDYGIFSELGWIAQYKYNDTRCMIKYSNTKPTQLWNRHAEMMRTFAANDELQEQLTHIQEQLGPGYHLLDGGLLHQKHASIKNTIVIWDILVHNGQHLLGTTYQERYKIIETLQQNKPYLYGEFTIGNQITPNVFIPQNHQHNTWDQCWQEIDKINEPFLKQNVGPVIEGLMFKDPNGILKPGFNEKNNGEWQVRSRITTGRHVF